MFRGTFEVPAGPFEYKVALNGSWDENYGAGGAPGGANIPLEAPGGQITFTYDHATHVITDDAPVVLGRVRAAHWLRRGLFAWDAPDAAAATGCTWRPRAGWRSSTGRSPATRTRLTPSDAPVPARLPAPGRPRHASSCPRRACAPARELLTGQLVVAAYDAAGALVGATGVQIPGVLDDLYASAAHARLGPTWHGAHAEARGLGADGQGRPAASSASAGSPMRRGRDGVWRIEGRPSWRDAAYAYEVTVYVRADEVVTNVVTDPYSLGAHHRTRRRSLLVDLDDRHSSRPAGTGCASRSSPSPRTRRSTSCTCGTSRSPTRRCPPRHRGTYLAFTDDRQRRHARTCAASPAAASTRCTCCRPSTSRRSRRTARRSRSRPATCRRSRPTPRRSRRASSRSATPTASTGATTRCTTRRRRAPTPREPDGSARTREFREMVTGINRAGLRVVMDVVYNHTPAAGQDPKSVLDRIVPGYYHRLSPTGIGRDLDLLPNTATEHRMMEKLMVDSVVTWAREYKVDGFRFDLMGHHSKANMLKVRRALDRLTLAGRRRRQAIYVYGEGWNFGEVANDARFVQATQLNMAGTGIGTFSRPPARRGARRRPVRRGPAHPGLRHRPVHRSQRRRRSTARPSEQRARLLLYQDQIKVGLAGNLRDYTLRRPQRADGDRLRGRLQRPAGRLRRRADRDDHLRRRARQRDAVRRAASTSCRRRPRWPTGCG